MKKILLLVLSLFASLPLGAAEYQSGKLTGYISSQVGANQLVIFQITSNVVGGCNFTGRFAVDSSKPMFKGVQATIMAAYHSQSPITVAYTQTCTSWDNSFDILGVCVGTIPC